MFQEKLRILHDGYDPMDVDEVAEWENEQNTGRGENMFKFFFQSSGAGKTVNQKPFEDLFRTFQHTKKGQGPEHSNPFHREDVKRQQQQKEQQSHQQWQQAQNAQKQQQTNRQQHTRNQEDHFHKQQQWQQAQNPQQTKSRQQQYKRTQEDHFQQHQQFQQTQNTQQQQTKKQQHQQQTRSRQPPNQRYQSEMEPDREDPREDRSKNWHGQSTPRSEERHAGQSRDQQRQFWTERQKDRYKQTQEPRSSNTKQQGSRQYSNQDEHLGKQSSRFEQRASDTTSQRSREDQTSKKRKRTKKKKTKSVWSDTPSSEAKEATHRYTKGTDGKWYHKQMDGTWAVHDGPPPHTVKKKPKKASRPKSESEPSGKSDNKESGSASSYMDEKGNFFVKGSDGNWYMRVKPPPEDETSDRQPKTKPRRSEERETKTRAREDRPKVLPKGLFVNDHNEISDQFGNLYERQADGRFKTVFLSEEGKGRLKQKADRQAPTKEEAVTRKAAERKIFRDSAGNMFVKDAHGNLIKVKSESRANQQQTRGPTSQRSQEQATRATKHHTEAEDDFPDEDEDFEEEEDEMDDRYSKSSHRESRQFRQGGSGQRYSEEKHGPDTERFRRFRDEFRHQQRGRRKPEHEEL